MVAFMSRVETRPLSLFFLFVSALALIASLARAHHEIRLEDKLKLYCQAKLLIIDEIGNIPIDRLGANLFFQLISRRYERGAMIMISNQPYSNWGEVLEKNKSVPDFMVPSIRPYLSGEFWIS